MLLWIRVSLSRCNLVNLGLTWHIKRQQEVEHRRQHRANFAYRLDTLIHQPPLRTDADRVQKIEQSIPRNVSPKNDQSVMLTYLNQTRACGAFPWRLRARYK